MDIFINNYLSKLEFGKINIFNNMGVIPLFTSIDENPQYLTLKEALEKRFLNITEVSQGGSVPELKVVNKADIPVLLLDGEELSGAKQNRVLNTTILLKENSDTIIPVSCTEQGRWAYSSRAFALSGNIMNRRARGRKVASVSRSLKDCLAYDSNQEEVWEEIACCSGDADISSPTGAMKDVFESKEEDLREYLNSFQYIHDQKGAFVMVNGMAVGFDILSHSHAYELLHQKIVKSYAIDALFRQAKIAEVPSVDKAKAFIEAASGCEEKRYESIGYGWDHRFEGKTIVGSSLIYQEKVIHMAFFRVDESDRVGTISSSSRRRRFRM